MRSVRYELEGVVARLHVCEAIGVSTVRDLDAALDRAEQELARSLLLDAPTGAFAVGLHGALLPQLAPTSRRQFARELGRVLLRMFQFPRPVICAMTGDAIGIGLVLALACDVRIAAEGPYDLRLRELGSELPLPGYALEIARTQIPNHAHMRLIALGEAIGVDEAHEMGLIDRVVEADQLDLQARIDANRFATLPHPAFSVNKRALHVKAAASALAREDADLDVLLRSSTQLTSEAPTPLDEAFAVG